MSFRTGNRTFFFWVWTSRRLRFPKDILFIKTSYFNGSQTSLQCRLPYLRFTSERRKKKSYAFYLCVFLRHLFFQRQPVYVSSDILEIVVRAKRQLLSLHERRVKEHKGESTSKRVSMGFNSYIEKWFQRHSSGIAMLHYIQLFELSHERITVCFFYSSKSLLSKRKRKKRYKRRTLRAESIWLWTVW